MSTALALGSRQAAIVRRRTAARTVLDIRLPMPHPGQRAVLRAINGATRFAFLDAGRRWFKTTLDMTVAVERALAGKEVMWGGPTYDQVRIGMTETRRAVGNTFRFTETRMEAEAPGGGIIRWRSLDDPDNARGFTADVVIVDEAGDVPERAWYEVLRPMLMSTGGGALVNGTAKGRNWFWREWAIAVSGERRDAAAWQVPTLGARIEVDAQTGARTLMRVPHPMENPHIAWNEIEHLFRTLPDRVFRQEVLAEWLEDAGGVFHGVRACIGAVPLARPERGAQYVIGCDLAKHQDWTVLSVFDLRARRQVALHRWQHQEWPLTKARIITLAREWNDALVWLDATGAGDPIFDDLMRAGLHIKPYKFTAQSKAALYENAVLMVEQQLVTLLAVDVQTNELEAFQVRRSSAGNYVMSAPDGLHDDVVTAFALAAWAMGHAAHGIPQSAIEQLTGTPVSEIGGARILGRMF